NNLAPIRRAGRYSPPGASWSLRSLARRLRTNTGPSALASWHSCGRDGVRSGRARGSEATGRRGPGRMPSGPRRFSGTVGGTVGLSRSAGDLSGHGDHIEARDFAGGRHGDAAASDHTGGLEATLAGVRQADGVLPAY